MKPKLPRAGLAAITAALGAIAFAAPAQAATFTVTNTNASGAGSLADAITQANASAGDDVINVQSGLGTIFYSGGPASIALKINAADDSGLTINGNGVVLDGENEVELLEVSTDATLNDLTVQNGDYTTASFQPFDGGGGIYNSADLTLNRVTVRDNHTNDHGGGIFNAGGTLTLNDSHVTGNVAEGNGGGIFSDGSRTEEVAVAAPASVTINGGSVTGNLAGAESLGGGIYNHESKLEVTNATIDGNTVDGGDGGGVYNDGGDATITRSAITNNGLVGEARVYRGGGIFNDTSQFGTLTLENDTIAGNVTGFTGGGIYNVVIAQQVPAAAVDSPGEDDAFLTNVTISDNTAGDGNGGGIATDVIQLSAVPPFVTGAIAIQNSIVSGNHGASDGPVDNCDGAVDSLGNNLENADSCSFGDTGDQANVADPKLGALAANGGPTKTMALAADSPAVNTANDSACPATDQRGVTRPQQSHCDIGAYEYQPPAQPQQPVQQSQSTPQLVTKQPLPGNPKLAVAGVRRACVARGHLTIRVRAAVAAGAKLKSVTVTLDGRRVKVTKRASFRLKLNVRKLRPGRHRVRITVRDSAGHRAVRTRVIARCAQAKPKRRSQPRFTG